MGMTGAMERSKFCTEAVFDLARLDNETWRIFLQGALPFGWERNLTLGLSSMNINILSGGVKRITRSQWRGELIVEPLTGSLDLEHIDFESVMKRGSAIYDASVFAPAITNYIVKDCFKDNGTLYVKVEGRDSVGFLAGLLQRLGSCMLFPVGIDIQTTRGNVRDELHLMGTAGIRVSGMMKENAEAALGGLLRR